MTNGKNSGFPPHVWMNSILKLADIYYLKEFYPAFPLPEQMLKVAYNLD